jgi:hypothetical protein
LATSFKEGGGIFTFFETGKKGKKSKKVKKKQKSPRPPKEVANLLVPRSLGRSSELGVRVELGFAYTTPVGINPLSPLPL